METMLFGIAGRVLIKLADPALQEIQKSWVLGSKDELKNLEGTLSTIKAVLLDAEEKQETTEGLKVWLKKLKLAFYEVDDLLDDFSVEFLKRKVMTRGKRAKKVRVFFSRSNQIAFRFKMGSRVKTIRNKMNAVADDRTKFGNLVDRSEVPKVNRREESHSSPPSVFMGREEDKKIVEQMLRDEVEANVSTISIVGIGGMGKTTLAQSVHRVEKDTPHFELVMWVCVSDVFDVKRICKSIIQSATGRECTSSEMEGVKNKLKGEIDGKRYFLVLDDVWSENPMEWLKLENLLSGGARGSKILVTTRFPVVAETVKSSKVHELKSLSPEESWSLFKEMAFGQGQEPDSPIKRQVGKEVSEKCSGVPLAICAIGSMMGLKKEDSDWSYFKHHKLSKMTQDSKNGIMPILKLSYDYLSPYLKQCFAYCAVFPKDHEIYMDALVRMWVAHGFIHLSERNEILEEVGEQYFMELLKRSFFQEYERDIMGRVYCKMHDLIHDLAQSLQGSEVCTIDDHLDDVVGTTRHAWVSAGIQTFPFEKAKNLRTCLFNGDGSNRLELGKMIDRIMESLERIRVLHMVWLDVPSLPGCIGRLTHLSYLDLSSGTFQRLPEPICDLHNLQTLKISHCYSLRELPRGTKKLVNLRHLDMTATMHLLYMPRGLGELTNLRTLGLYTIGPAGGSLGEQLDELKILAVNFRGKGLVIACIEEGLDISKTPNGCKDPFHSNQKISLEHLVYTFTIKLYTRVLQEDLQVQLAFLENLQPPTELKTLKICFYGVSSLPSWMNSANIQSSLPNIVKMTLSNWHGCVSLTPFGLLPSLQSLKLMWSGSLEYIYDEDDAAADADDAVVNNCSFLFRSLKVLHLQNLLILKGLVRRRRRGMRGLEGIASSSATPKQFPVLEELRIYGCPQLDLYEAKNTNKQFQCLDNLKTLVANTFSDLETLPEWIGDLTSLEHLELKLCKSLASLPDYMRRLTSLQTLVIRDCSPEFESRCEKDIGEDWPKIAHIPLVTVERIERKEEEEEEEEELLSSSSSSTSPSPEKLCINKCWRFTS